MWNNRLLRFGLVPSGQITSTLMFAKGSDRSLSWFNSVVEFRATETCVALQSASNPG